MKRFICMAFAVIAILVLGVAVWWTASFPSGTWRYKMTVTVETPEGDRTGFAVREVMVTTGIKLGPQSLPNVKLRGEAIAIDLGERGTLFALLSGYKKGPDYGEDIPALVFSPTKAVMRDETIRYMGKLKNTKPVRLNSALYPVFIHFRDPNDPRTVEGLLQMKSCPDPVTKVPYSSMCLVKDRFEEVFGDGVRLKSVTIEMTDEEVTLGVGKLLPWFEERRKLPGYLGGSSTLPYEDKSKTYLTPNSFIQGDKR